MCACDPSIRTPFCGPHCRDRAEMLKNLESYSVVVGYFIDEKYTQFDEIVPIDPKDHDHSLFSNFTNVGMGLLSKRLGWDTEKITCISISWKKVEKETPQ